MDVVADDNGGTLTKYQNGLGIDDKLKVSTNGTAKYFLQDHLGSTVGLTNQSGEVSEQTSYDSFGNAANNLLTRYQFTGREYDSFTGLNYYRARWYDSKTGRFVSEDPIGLNGGINKFAYANNNASNLADPNGLDGCRKLPNGRCEPVPSIPTGGGEPPRRPPTFISDPPPTPSPTPTAPSMPPMSGGYPPQGESGSSSCDCFDVPRFPDFYTVNGGVSARNLPLIGKYLPEGLGGGVSLTADRYAGIYIGVHGGFNFPGSYTGLNGSVGWMLQRCKPKKEELSNFLSGESTSIGGFTKLPLPILAFVPTGGYYTYNDNGQSLNFGASTGTGGFISKGYNSKPWYIF